MKYLLSFKWVLLFAIILLSCSSPNTRITDNAQVDENRNKITKFDPDSLLGKWKSTTDAYQEIEFTGKVHITYSNKIEKNTKQYVLKGDTLIEIYRPNPLEPEIYYWKYKVKINEKLLELQNINKDNETTTYRRQEVTTDDEKPATQLVTEVKNTTKSNPQVVEDAGRENYYTVISDKSYLFNDADLSTKRKGYIIKDDIVNVIKIEGNFAYVFYTEKELKSWVLLNTLEKGQNVE